ncbi:MAG: hypothetical protein C0515_07285 [Novosphingobium sp.]|nr:hypothetical protein [Novosphingobium sp.]
MSQEEAAIASDLSARTIQRIESGQPASLESTKALLTIFGSDIIHDPSTFAKPVERRSWLMTFDRIGRAMGITAKWSFDALRLLFVAVFLLIAFAKPFVPDKTGLFVTGNKYVLGLFVPRIDGSSEVLGYWIIPVMVLAAMALLMTIDWVRRQVWLQLDARTLA